MIVSGAVSMLSRRDAASPSVAQSGLRFDRADLVDRAGVVRQRAVGLRLDPGHATRTDCDGRGFRGGFDESAAIRFTECRASSGEPFGAVAASGDGVDPRNSPDETVLTPTTTAMTARPDSAPRGTRRPLVAGRRPRFADSCSMAADGPRPQVAGWLRRGAAHRAQRLAIGLVRRGDGGTRRTTGEMLVEPGRLGQAERSVEALGGADAGALVRRRPVVGAAADAAEAAHRSDPVARAASRAASAAASAARSAARAWRRLSRARVSRARAAT